MSDETPIPQTITAGDGNEIYQAAGDFTIHNNQQVPAKVSSIQIPTNLQISQYDPKVRIILDACKYYIEPNYIYKRKNNFSITPAYIGVVYLILFEALMHISALLSWIYSLIW